MRGSKNVKPLREMFGIVAIVRLTRRREIERRARSLLVQIHGHLRKPLQKRLDAPLRLGMRLREPVAIQIEVVVRRARTGPRTGVVHRLRITRRALIARHPLEVVREPLATVRVFIRIDQHHSAVEGHQRFGIRTSRELIEQRESRFHSRCFTTMHGMFEPHDRRHAFLRAFHFTRRRATWIGDALRVALNFRNAGNVRLTRHRQQQHLAPFERVRYGVHLHASGRRGNAFDVAHHRAMRRESLSDLVAQQRARCRYPRVVAAHNRGTGLGEGVLRQQRRCSTGQREGDSGPKKVDPGTTHAAIGVEW